MPHPAQYKTFDNLKQVSKKSNTPECVEVQDIDHRKQIINNNKIVVIYLFGDWCQPCKFVAPMYNELSQLVNSDRNVILVKENVTKHLTVDYKASAIPAFIFYNKGELVRGKDGKVVDVIGGNMDEIKGVLSNLLR